MTNKISRCYIPLAGLIALSVVAELLLPAPAPAKQKPWLQQLREFVGHNPLIAPGGSRGQAARRRSGPLGPADRGADRLAAATASAWADVAAAPAFATGQRQGLRGCAPPGSHRC